MKLITGRDKIAFVDNKNNYSYSELIAHCGAWSDALTKKEAKRILILSENRVEYIFALYGAWLAGAEVIPVDAMATVEEIAYIILDASPDMFITSETLKSHSEKAIELASATTAIVLLDDTPPSSKKPLKTILIDTPDKVACIIYTSGTTGSPKGVMLSFSNLMSNVIAVCEDVPFFTERETILMLLPVHHILPLVSTILAPLYGGCTIALSPSLKGEDITSTLATHAVTMVVGVPRLYTVILRGILAKIEKNSVARLLWFLAGKTTSRAIRKTLFVSVHKKFGGHIRWFIAGGAKLDVEITKGYQRLGFEILEGYGMSETSPIISFPRIDNYRLGSTGQPLFEDSVRIADGEVQVRGNHVMKGYLNKPEETAATFDGEWLKTGDLGYLDSDNYLFITGRKKEIIVLPSGKNIQPEELEGKLTLSYPIISEVAVFLDTKEQLHALIVPDSEKVAENKIININDHIRWEILDTFNRSLSSYKRISAFTLLSTPLPRTRMQKLRRFLLPDLAQHKERKESQSTAPDSPLYRDIISFLQKITDETVSPDDHIEIDLGIDSLDKMELVTLITKKSGITMTEQDISNNATPLKIIEFVKKEGGKKKKEGGDWKKLLHTSTIEGMPYSGLPHKMLRPLFILAAKLYFKLSGSHSGVINPSQSVIFASNHQSFLDALFVSAFMPRELFYRTYFFAKEKHFNRGWKRWLAKRINVVIMKDNSSVIDALKSMSFVLRNGGNVMIFPEGTRTRDGKLGSFKKSFALLAFELKIPVVPVIISGAFEAFPIHTKMPKFRAPVTVSFLEQVFSAEYTQDELNDATKRRISHSL